MAEELDLKLPSMEDRDQWLAYIREFILDDPSAAPLDFQVDMDYEVWLTKVQNEHAGINLEPGRVPVSVYFLMKKQRILGHLSIRHSIATEFLSNYGGHIGYGVRPSERRKGYARLMLKMGLEKCRDLGLEQVMVTCKQSNIGSIKVIEKNGGILTKENLNPQNNEIFRVYWIKNLMK